MDEPGLEIWDEQRELTPEEWEQMPVYQAGVLPTGMTKISGLRLVWGPWLAQQGDKTEGAPEE